ncbi:MAG: SHD1 domain-containing protein, partial [Pirellulaceae bacterium]|nr:SHD1 domain-containing protein [Pirellulaceae bacterium]
APADDLFGTPSTEPAKPTAPADDLFGTPSTEPAPAKGSLDDLFGPSSDAAPSAPPAESEPVVPPPTKNEPPITDLDDLFKSTGTGSNAKSEKPVSVDKDSDPNFDSLFANPAERLKGNTPKSTPQRSGALGKPSMPEKQIEKTKALKDDLEDLFKSSSLKKDDSFLGADFREWIDNTGDYAVHARLAVIFPDRIRLLKENGKFTTVPMSRLSDADRDYVTWVAVSLSKGPAVKFVNTEIDPGSANTDIAR